MPLYGVYTGNELSKYQSYTQWLGAPAGFIEGHGGRSNWSDWRTSLIWFITDKTTAGLATGAPIYFSIPLIPSGASLADGSAGKFNGNYYDLAKAMLTALASYKSIVVRTGWEFNGGWQPWASKGREAQFVGSFRNFVSQFRQAAKDAGRAGVFLFNWGYNHGQNDPMPSYPGDDYVDIISSDIYLKNDAISGDFDPKDPAEAFQKHLTQQGGYQYTVDLARKRGKLAAFDEIGVTGNDSGPYLDRTFQFMDANQDVVAYVGYWMSDAAYPGNLMLSSRSKAGATYKAGILSRRNQGWPQKGTTPPATTPPVVTPTPETPIMDEAPKGRLDLLFGMNEGSFKVTSAKTAPEPVLRVYYQIEDAAYRPLQAYSYGGKGGTVPAGKEGDPVKALALIHTLTGGDVTGWPNAEMAQVLAWHEQAETLLKEAGALPEEEPEPVEPEQPGTGEIEALKAALDEATGNLKVVRQELASLSMDLAQEKAARAAADQRIAKVAAALA